MDEASPPVRSSSFGQHRAASPVDRLGVWLTNVAVRRHARFDGARVADLGCGYEATLVRSLLPRIDRAVLVDVALAPDLHQHPKLTVIEASIPEVLPSLATGSFEVTMCLSVLEHLREPQEAVDHLHRITAPGGTLLLNVPSWAGKRALELSAFRLGLSPAEEMDDHKWYFDPRDLWPMLVRAGFKPSGITCHRHKLGLNTFAACQAHRPEETPRHA